MERLWRDGFWLYFEDVGKGAPPILLIHDLGSDHTSLQPQLEYFQNHHRVVAPDLPGHGQSEGPAGRCRLARVTADLAWLCYELGLYRPVAVGRGTGGLIALELYARYPNLLAAALVLDAPAWLSPMKLRARRVTRIRGG